ALLDAWKGLPGDNTQALLVAIEQERVAVGADARIRHVFVYPGAPHISADCVIGSLWPRDVGIGAADERAGIVGQLDEDIGVAHLANAEFALGIDPAARHAPFGNFFKVLFDR